MLTRRLFTLGLGSLLVSAVACGGCGKKSDDITVGAYLSLSGSDSTFGTDTRDGIELAVDEVNAAGGVKGKKVKVLYEDDKSTTQEASQKVRQLIDRDQGRDWVFRTCFTDQQQGQVAARFVHDELKKTKVGVFYAAQDTYSSGLARSFREEFKRLGGEIVVDKGYPKGETNFTTCS